VVEFKASIRKPLTRVQLGGIGDDGTYALGDDALVCLKDLRKWLKFADGQLNRRDVARCMAEANLVKGDLLEILAKVSPRVLEQPLKHKLAVATRESKALHMRAHHNANSRTTRALDLAVRDRSRRSNRESPPPWPIRTTCPDWLQARDSTIRPRPHPSDRREGCASVYGNTTTREVTTRRGYHPNCSVLHTKYRYAFAAK
jgi:hypothetical protein